MPASTLTHRCWNHRERPAVARCIECGRHYCRECVAEHDGRMICASCLRLAQAGPRTARRWFQPAVRVAHTLAAVFLVWLFFHLVAQLLLRVPSRVHEGTIWSEDWWTRDEP